MSTPEKPKLWHSYNTRSLRPLWALEEMGIDYDLEVLAFPPRFLEKDYLQTNLLGTVPYFKDSLTEMTESSAICHYLVDRYQQYDFGLRPEHPEYGSYLNWLYHSDATLTFPQTIVLRYHSLEKEERKLPQAVTDYAKWFLARLRHLDNHLSEREFLCDNRFTVADITICYALHFGELLGLDEHYTDRVSAYLKRLKERPAFQRVQAIGEELDPFKTMPPSQFDL